ncbi:MAG TPA: hypothetical protein PLV68_21190 [Ilumatobacteraceae bacterium]|nr:hypothetical protein [Ilumatobacteraceae bacterium]
MTDCVTADGRWTFRYDRGSAWVAGRRQTGGGRVVVELTRSEMDELAKAWDAVLARIGEHSTHVTGRVDGGPR